MPRKTQFTPDEIIDAAYAMVKEKGWEGLSVTAVAKRIGASTMPIYSYFENLEKLKDAVVIRGWENLMAYQTQTYTGDVWIDQSIAYINFAKDEKRIFYCMFDGRNLALQRQINRKHWDCLGDFLEGYGGFKGLSEEEIFLIRYSRAMFSHGLAMSVTSNLGALLTAKGIVEHLSTAVSRAVLKGYKTQYDIEDPTFAFLDREIKKIGKTQDTGKEP